MTVWLALGLVSVLAEGGRSEELSWIPQLGLALSFRLDALSGLFSILITGIGTCIVVYGAQYFDGHPYSGRFQATLFAFMGAMLGVVLADNGLLLFVFWELTGFTSYLLVGFDHDERASRRAALQALIVTGSGGLALLAGVVMLADASGSSSLIAGRVQDHAHYLPIVLCFLAAAFTKSAQFPFHFWLPNAMAAPTPVSAYLHSATMVKAGVYLVARMTPALGGTSTWTTLIVAVSTITMLGAALRALRETDLKKILAYSTVSALGTMMLLFGLGTPACVAAGLAYLLAHALYKGALFLVAGIIDHETGTRDVTRLAGLRRMMPLSAVAGALAAVSMAGLPPFFGFVAKEHAYGAVLGQPFAPLPLIAVLVVSSALLGAAGLVAGVSPFAGAPSDVRAHEAPAAMFTMPLLLSGLGLAGLLAPWASFPVSAAASEAFGGRVTAELSLWHGLSMPLALSTLTLVVTFVVYSRRDRLQRKEPAVDRGPERLYDAGMGALDAISKRLGAPLGDGSLGSYVLVLVTTTSALTGVALFSSRSEIAARSLLTPRLHELLLVGLVMTAALSAVRAKTTIRAVLSLGTAGYSVALMFSLYGAPDLAMTQFAVETLTAVIFVYVFWQFPKVVERSARTVRWRDGVISIAIGVLITVLTFSAAVNPTSSRLRDFYAEAAPKLAHGRNIVNVILVDFRALDTLGEITVLVTAAVGVAALLRIAAEEKRAS